MTPVTDHAVAAAVANYFKTPRIHASLSFLARRLPVGAGIFVAGGAPRNIVMAAVLGHAPSIADIDVFIGGLDPDFRLVACLEDQAVRPTDLHGIRWRPAASPVAYDLSLLPDFVGIQAGRLDPTLENLLESIDFTVNAIAYDVRTQGLFENGAVDGVRQRMLEFTSGLIPDRQLMAYRILLMQHKTGFRLSRTVFQFLRQQLDLTTAIQLESLFKAKVGRRMAAAIMSEYDALCRCADYAAYCAPKRRRSPHR